MIGFCLSLPAHRSQFSPAMKSGGRPQSFFNFPIMSSEISVIQEISGEFVEKLAKNGGFNSSRLVHYRLDGSLRSGISLIHFLDPIDLGYEEPNVHERFAFRA